MSRNQRRNRRNRSGGSQPANREATRDTVQDQSAGAVHYRSSTETKSSLKTTELVAYAGAVLGVIMTALAIDADRQGGDDPFGAESAIRYITYLTIGYMVARGLAKSGSHEIRVEHDTDSVDDDAARPLVADDEIAPDDDGDELESDADIVGTADEPSAEVEHAETEKADARS